MTIAAVFLDRDGILNEYLPGAYVRSPDEFRLIPGVAPAVRRLNDAGVIVVVVSNQQGVGKGLMTRDDLDAVEGHMCLRLMDDAGAILDRCYYCTDLSGSASVRRKPEPGMLLEAAAEFGFDVRDAVMIGDSATDIAAGHAAGVAATALILSGSLRRYEDGDMSPKPNRVFGDLNAAVDWLLELRTI